MLVLSVDPGGEKGVGASGWCYQDENKVYAMGDTQDLKGFLKKWDIKKLPVNHVVVEGYFINPRQNKAQAHVGVPLTQIENVGVVKLWAEMQDIPWTEYFNNIKSTQAKHSGVFPKTMRKDIEHKFDAFNHGWWYLYKQGLVLTKLEKEMKAKGKL